MWRSPARSATAVALLSVLMACSSSRAGRPGGDPLRPIAMPSTLADVPLGPTPAHVGPLDARVSEEDLDALEKYISSIS